MSPFTKASVRVEGTGEAPWRRALEKCVSCRVEHRGNPSETNNNKRGDGTCASQQDIQTEKHSKRQKVSGAILRGKYSTTTREH